MGKNPKSSVITWNALSLGHAKVLMGSLREFSVFLSVFSISFQFSVSFVKKEKRKNKTKNTKKVFFLAKMAKMAKINRN
jgi:hypothetical protein